ncbi:hypothetical protein AYI92_06380 [Shewanella xiamenensis]|uniref:erythromycin esterase family protein n=1 Tax=Shewanella xiamenensis TaxID=332186 RepID=UPI0011846E22|nr:erythromycin esterase family protein [Shewanella xiamenensis]TVL21121.1 hypothetical protein AYI90_06760 [Shewanella xiamenensis]TVL21386.1 hypothetical protein AYI91_08110 [Shewanella xiamenensis]TVL27329.1 hypothetical protein AYI92_06380 [Shewanella xiamenensis]TVL34876.1 hypothetical protein AYI93_06995 [Shewanella xiamenensis]TVP03522.1 hypothetical protein AYI89_06980 [Shewanella xiamenensis]
MNYLKILLIFLLLTPVDKSLACDSLPDSVDVAVQKYSILLVGESHGTKEAPEAFYNIVCSALATSPKDITVGLELTSVDGITLRESDSLIQLVEASKEWLGPHDGRTSSAIYQLLEKLIIVKQSTPQLSILLFNSNADNRDYVMAQTILKNYHGQKMLIYSGDYHTKLTIGTEWDEHAEQMGYLIKQRHPSETYSIKLRYDGGTAWSWQETIGIHNIGKAKLPVPFKTQEMDAGSGYNLMWNIGPVSASLPHVTAEISN